MYTLANMQDSIKKVEATRAQRMATEPRRMTADEKDALLAAYHPDYKEEGFITLKVGPNKGEKVPTELGYLLESNSRILGVDIDLDKVDYDVDVLVIGAGGAGSSAAIEAHEAGANVMIIWMRSAADTLLQDRNCSANWLWKLRMQSPGWKTWALCLIKMRMAVW